MAKKIDEQYFSQYSTTGNVYSKCWKNHTNVDGMIKHIIANRLPHEIIGVLGTATGEILYYLSGALKIMPFGCEISKYAYDQIKDPFQSYVKNVHMLDYLKGPIIHDFIFSNSLGYLKGEKELQEVLKEAKEKTTFFYFDPPAPHFPDEYRNISEPRSWWNEQFQKAGFKMIRRSLFIGEDLWVTKKNVKS